MTTAPATATTPCPHVGHFTHRQPIKATKRFVRAHPVSSILAALIFGIVAWVLSAPTYSVLRVWWHAFTALGVLQLSADTVVGVVVLLLCAGTARAFVRGVRWRDGQWRGLRSY